MVKQKEMYSIWSSSISNQKLVYCWQSLKIVTSSHMQQINFALVV